MQSVAGVVLARPDRPPQVVQGQLFAPAIVHGREMILATPSFFQTNLDLLARLIDRLREEAGPLPGKRVADVYSGVGVFGLFMADEAREVVAIESDPLAVEAGRRTAAAWGMDNIRFVAADAAQALAGDEGFDVVVVDPPRSGLTPLVLDSLARLRPPLILYVSCLAQSLARDARDLAAAGYRLEQLELFDFYPQTYHVELLAVLQMD
jgi:23S rRNA (uracil1939-C5)-methyltransferase